MQVIEDTHTALCLTEANMSKVGIVIASVDRRKGFKHQYVDLKIMRTYPLKWSQVLIF